MFTRKTTAIFDCFARDLVHVESISNDLRAKSGSEGDKKICLFNFRRCRSRRSKVSGQWSVISGQWSVVSGR
jgi:hypothetical protein